MIYGKVKEIYIVFTFLKKINKPNLFFSRKTAHKNFEIVAAIVKPMAKVRSWDPNQKELRLPRALETKKSQRSRLRYNFLRQPLNHKALAHM